MAWQDSLQPGVYIDHDGSIWEKRGTVGDGKWFVNGAEWTPFPVSLRMLDEGFVREHLGRHETLLETQIRIERMRSQDPEIEPKEPDEYR